jgi:hypothetical protein
MDGTLVFTATLGKHQLSATAGEILNASKSVATIA